MVGKLFSDIAKERMESNRNRVDWMASEHGLGPTMYASTKEGILMEWLGGEGLTETIVHSTSDWITNLAPRLAAFNSMEIPPRPPHMLWETIDIMETMTRRDASLAHIEDEVLRQRELLEPLDLPVVLGHGDLKPSNIIGDRFIDFEVSGMHYRGFDLAKLFRTDHPTVMSVDNINMFLECYLKAVQDEGDDCKRTLDMLKLETKLMEPLTWLEAAVFFLCSASVDRDNAETWNRLAADRLESYDESKHDLKRYIDKYGESQ